MPSFIPVLTMEELPAEGFKAVEVQGRSILVGRLEGHIFAWLDRCPHAGTPLRIGKRRGEELTCMRHGWIFNLLSGKAVPDAPGCELTKIPLQIDGSQISLNLTFISR